MDEQMEVLMPDDASFPDDIDSVYEFDAHQVFDLTRDETASEAEEAESWFRFAHEYPPSPFVAKLKMMKAAKSNSTNFNKTSSKKAHTSSISDGDIDHKSSSGESKIKDVRHNNHIPQDITKSKSESPVNLPIAGGSSSSFMKPTASHLAKQNKECDTHSGGYGRLQKPVVSAVEKLRSPIRTQNQATKRQKLDIGYLRKAAQLRHRASFSHKFSKQDTQLEGNSQSRVKTNPIKPALITEERAQMHRSQNKPESVQHPKANFRAEPLNRKIFDTPKLPQHKSMTHSTEFQVHYKQNSAPAVSDDIIMKSQNSGKKDKSKSPNNLKCGYYEKVHPIKDGGFSLNSKRNSQLPPTELFKKLSLKDEPETKVISSTKPLRGTKSLKENVGQQEFRRCAGKPNHCGTDRMITEVKT